MDQTKSVKASVIDGIAITPRYRERQLAKLHQALLQARTELIQAIVDDSNCTTGEATAQYLLVSRAVKTHHQSVNPKDSIEQEYQIAKGKDNTTRRS